MSTDVLERKIRRLLAHAMFGLSLDDRAARVLWCQRTGQHGVTAEVEGAMVVFSWGGRTLCAVERALLADDDAEIPPGVFVRAVPDTVPDEWE